MVWGCITSKGVGRIRRVVGKMDAKQYIQILNDGLLGTLQDRDWTTPGIYFQQDLAPTHCAKITKQWITQNEIDVLKWTAHSPDMSIIENAWHHLETKVRARKPLPRNLTELWHAIEEEWYNISSEYISSLYKSMPARVAALKKAKGSLTKY